MCSFKKQQPKGVGQDELLCTQCKLYFNDSTVSVKKILKNFLTNKKREGYYSIINPFLEEYTIEFWFPQCYGLRLCMEQASRKLIAEKSTGPDSPRQ